METKNNDKRLSGLKVAIKATLISTPLLISACGGGGTGETPKPIPGPGTGPEPKNDIKANIQAATVRITTVGDAIIPNGLTSIDIQKRGWGSGFFIDETGYIVTNNHVVTGAGQLSVEIDGVDLPYPAELVGVAECEDLAVIRTTMGNNGFEALKWSDANPEINMSVGASGFPSDVKNSVNEESVYTFTTGTINTDVRLGYTSWASTFMFDHSARIASGNSGGPVIDMETGDVLGVNYASNPSRFHAISSSEAKRIVSNIIQGNDVLSIGISAEVVFKYEDQNGNMKLAFQNKVPYGVDAQPYGVWVKGVQAGGKAKRIGIQAGDIITAVAGVKLQFDRSDDSTARAAKRTLGKYCNVLRSNNPNRGTTLDIEIIRPKAGGAICAGEINGDRLSLKQDTAMRCPELSSNINPVETPVVISGELNSSDPQFNWQNFNERYVDLYTIDATLEGEVVVEMRSNAINSALKIAHILPGGEYAYEYFNEDNYGKALNDRITFNKQRGHQYIILATSANPLETGPYKLHFTGFSNSEFPRHGSSIDLIN